MPELSLNPKKDWQPSYEGEYSGVVIESYNVSPWVRNQKLTVATKIYPHTTTDDISTIGLPTSTAPDSAKNQWMVADKVYKSNTPLSASFVADSTTNSPTGLTDSEFVVYGQTTGADNFVVTLATDLAYFTGGGSAWDKTWWTGTLGQTAFSTSGGHVTLTFGDTPFLYVSDGNFIHAIATPVSPTSSDVYYRNVSLPGEYQITWMVKSLGKIYIGTKALNDIGKFRVYSFDPINSTLAEFNLEVTDCIGFIYNEALMIIDNKGYISEFTGNGFSPLTRFKSFQENLVFNLPHRNGIDIVNERIYMNIPTQALWPLTPAGVWCFDYNDKRLFHLGGLTRNKTAIHDYGEISGALAGGSGFLKTFVGDVLYLVAGTITATDSSGTNSSITGVWSNSNIGTVSGSSRGYIILSKSPASSQNAMWERIVMKYNPNPAPSGTQSNSSFITKYRNSDPSYITNTAFTGLWTATNQFTTTSTHASSWNVGDEVLIVSGEGSGFAAHISSIVTGTPNTITLDENLGLTTNIGFRFFVLNFKKPFSSTVSSTYTQSQEVDINTVGGAEWLQLKIEFRGSYDLEDILLGYQDNLKLEAR